MLDERAWEFVLRACRSDVIHVDYGRWELPARVGGREDLLGWVVITGLICREVELRDRHLLELLGPGDVVQPTAVADAPRIGEPPRMTAATQSTLFALGSAFIRLSARWPGALSLITRRLEAQRQRLAIQAVIAHVPRAEHRLLLQMWHLAQWWGRADDEGTVLALPLTHHVLGHLAAARRSTTTLALGALEDDGLVRRRDDGFWLLTPAAEARVSVLARTSRTGRLLGETLKLRQRASDIQEHSLALRAQSDQLLAGRGAATRGEPRLR